MIDSANATAENRQSRRNLLLGLLVPAAIVVTGLAWWLGLLTPEPDAVSLEETVQAVEAVEDQPATAETEPVDQNEQAATDSIDSIAGVWSVVEQDATFAGYRADGNTGEAVGRTSGVTGTLEATGDQISAVTITVDMTTLTSDSSLRDDHLGDEGIEYNTYPVSSFVLSEAIPIADIPTDGTSTAFEAVGNLTVRDTTLPVVIELEGALVGEQLVVVGATDINLDDFGASVSSTTEAVMEFSLVFTQ